MSLPSVTSTPSTQTLDFGNGIVSKTTYQYNSNNMPSSIVNDIYQNGVLTDENVQTFTYNNNIETVNWTNTNKTFNTSSSGTYSTTI